MCKLIVGFKKNNKELEKIRQAIRIQRYDLFKEPHGMAGLVIDKNNKVETIRELDDYQKVMDWMDEKLEGAKVFCLHSRTATDGTVNKDNVHYFKHKGYYFAHNGIVSECSSYGGYKRSGYSVATNTKVINKLKWGDYYEVKDEEDEELEKIYVDKYLKEEVEEERKTKSDSFEFVNKMKTPATVDSLYDDMEKLKFNGIAHLISPKEKKMFIMATRDIKMHTDFENYMINYSYEPENKIPEVKSMFGMDIVVDSNFEKLKKYSAESGIYEIDFSELDL